MDLNTILIILGILALAALIGHSIWSRRREKSQYFNNANTFSRESVPNFAQQAQPQNPIPNSTPNEPVAQTHSVSMQEPQISQQATTQSVEQIRIVLPNQSQAEYVQQVSYENQTKVAETESYSSIPLPNYEETNEPEVMPETYQQSPIPQTSFVEPVSIQSTETAETYSYGEKAREVSSYITLYLVAPENRQFQLAKLSQGLEELGLIFGKNNLFHYHLHMTIDSPVLFSVANINAPGSFEAHRLADGATVGVVFFMPLPSVGNTLANLKIMIHSARSLAEQLGGFVLTDEQDIFTEQSETEYLARVN